MLKILSRDITHKSDVGGVGLHLTTPEAVRAAATDMLARVKKLRPEARIAGVIVQAMVVRQGARADPRPCRRSDLRHSSSSAAAVPQSRSSMTRRWRYHRSTCGSPAT